MKKVILNIPDFDWSFNFSWEENAKIEFKIIDNNYWYIKANKEWLISLANHLLNLAQEDIFDNYHFHLDQFNSLERWSNELIVEKDNNI